MNKALIYLAAAIASLKDAREAFDAEVSAADHDHDNHRANLCEDARDTLNRSVNDIEKKLAYMTNMVKMLNSRNL